MAEAALEKLQEQLNCSVCLDTYTDPKQLQCNHVFCQQCLEPVVVRDRWRRRFLSCPTCRQVTPVPGRGVAGLQSAFHINHLLDIQDTVKNLDNQATASGGDLCYCPKHAEEELKLYCDTCQDLVCLQCVITNGEHHDHEYALLKEAFEKHREVITTSLEPVEKQITTIQQALAQLDTSCREIADQRAVIEDSIHTTFKRLKSVLEVRETDLIGQLNRITEDKMKEVGAQGEKMENTLAQLNSSLHFMRENLQTDSKRHLLRMKTVTAEQVNELTAPLKFVTAKADVAFSANSRLTQVCLNFGQVCIPALPDPSQCYVTGTGKTEAVVGETSTAFLHTINFEGRPCEESVKLLECELVSKVNGARASCGMGRTGQSQYKIKYRPTTTGKHQLHIKVDGQHVLGSPFSLAVVKRPNPAVVKPIIPMARSPVERVSNRAEGGNFDHAETPPVEHPGPTVALVKKPIFTTNGISAPIGVAVNESGEMVVTEEGRHCITVFSPDSAPRSFGTDGFRSSLSYPCGVAVDDEGNIIVADRGKHRIQKFAASGKFLAMVGSKGVGRLEFCNPADVAFNPNNRKLYVSDKNNCRIQVLNPDLTFFSAFGSAGYDEGQFHQAWGTACDITGKVYVADSGNNRVQVFTAEGQFLYMLGKHGQSKGVHLDWPCGITVDSTGKVYVSESAGHRIAVFNHDGHLLASYGRCGRKSGEFWCPRGLAVDSSGVLYLCDTKNSRVSLFVFK